jgi:hydroxypyruvate reductase
MVRSLREQRHDARVIFEASLTASDPMLLVGRSLQLDGEILQAGKRLYDLARYNNLYVVGAGKAAAKMARAVEALLGERIAGGLVIVKQGHVIPLKKLEIVEAGHPIPDPAGIKATEAIIQLLRRT